MLTRGYRTVAVCLAKKEKAKNLDPYDAFLSKLSLFSEDMRLRQKQPSGPQGMRFIVLMRGHAHPFLIAGRTW